MKNFISYPPVGSTRHIYTHVGRQVPLLLSPAHFYLQLTKKDIARLLPCEFFCRPLAQHSASIFRIPVSLPLSPSPPTPRQQRTSRPCHCIRAEERGAMSMRNAGGRPGPVRSVVRRQDEAAVPSLQAGFDAPVPVVARIEEWGVSRCHESLNDPRPQLISALFST